MKPPQPPKPTITAPTITPSTLPAGGGTVTINAIVTNASVVTLDGVAVTLPTKQPVTASHTFQLQAHGPSAASASLGVTVAAAPPAAPTITNFVAVPSALPVGGGNVTISADVANATEVTLDGAPVTLPATRPVTASHTFVLVAHGAVPPDATASVAVTVAKPVEPPQAAGVVGVIGSAYSGSQFRSGPVDFIDTAKLPAPMPWSVAYYDAATLKTAPHCKGVLPAFFRTLTKYGPTSALYSEVPRIVDGKSKPVYPNIGSNPVQIRLYLDSAYDDVGGPRGVSVPTPYTTVRGHVRTRDDGTVATSPFLPDWVGVSMDAWMWFYMPDGPITKVVQIAVDPKDAINDFTFYPPDRKIFFSIGRVSGKIYKTDRHGAFNPSAPNVEDFTLWVTTVYAQLPVTLDVNGQWAEGPSSLQCLTDGRMFAVDRAGNRIVQIVDDGTLTHGTPQPFCNVAFPFWLRHDSKENLIVATTNTTVHRIDMTTLQPSANLMPVVQGSAIDWITVAVDCTGSCGPVDDMFVVRDHGAGNLDSWRLAPGQKLTTSTDGATSIAGSSIALVGTCRFVSEPSGHYVWISEPHPEQGMLLQGGYSGTTPLINRASYPNEPADPYPDHGALRVAEKMILFGTVQGMPTTARPSFTAQFNMLGGSYLGCTPDYIASLSVANAIAFVQRGCLGSVPRPEITGPGLYALLYYLWRGSQQYLTGGEAWLAPMVAAVKATYTAGTIPVISNVVDAPNADGTRTVTWNTDIPTIGYVAFGAPGNPHRYSDIEPGYGLEHTATLRYIGSQSAIAVRARAQDGQWSAGAGGIYLPLAADQNVQLVPTVASGKVTITARDRFGNPGTPEPTLRLRVLLDQGRNEVDLGDAVGPSWSVPLPTLAAGAHGITVVVVDGAGDLTQYRGQPFAL